MSACTLALAGDTMLGRGVAETIRDRGPRSLFSAGVVDAAGEADVTVVNLECCISDRGHRWPDPAKPFFFRAPPAAVEALAHLGVDCVTLANNHALDFGSVALVDTLEHLRSAGIAAVGAGRDEEQAREPATIRAGTTSLAVVGLTDHPHDFAASGRRPGTAFADLRRGVPNWVDRTVRRARAEAELLLVTPHWGPNMNTTPVPHVRQSAPELLDAGATLVAGHSAHVFHGVSPRILWDLGGLVDDYAVHPDLRNDLGILWLVRVQGGWAVRADAVPIALDHCYTRLADDTEASWIGNRLIDACAESGAAAAWEDDRLRIDLR